MTRWLDDEEQRTWPAFLSVTQLLFDQLDREMQRDAKIPHAYYEVLVRLSEAPDRTLRMSQLADSTLSSRSRLSHAVSRLEESGWVERKSCPTDRRGQLAVLTDKGFGALEAAAPGHVEGLRSHAFDPLRPDKLAALRNISQTLLNPLVSERKAKGQSAGAAEL